MPMDYVGMHSNGFLGGYGWIFQIVIFILFFLIVFWLLRNQKMTTPTNETPEQILKRRLASGEIKKKEYEELMEEVTEPKKKSKTEV